MTRLEANLALLEALKDLINTYPDQRFSQLLENHAFVQHNSAEYSEGYISKTAYWTDEFFLEPEQLLNRVKANL